jgi:DNA modification methylase
VTVTDLSEVQLRVLRLALNRLGEDAKWDPKELGLEFSELFEFDPEFDLTLTGFEMGEIDVAIDGVEGDEEDELPEIDDTAEPVTKSGDMWLLGPDHRIICGNSLEEVTYQRLMGGELAEMIFADPPYGVAIEGHASGLGRVKHKNFVMGGAEMSPEELTRFFAKALQLGADYSIDGSIHFVCMDWRRQIEILIAGKAVFEELKNLCVWRKSNAGMGSLYRSQHELVFVLKKGKAPHINNVELGKHGRHRSNIWDYPSQNALNGTAKSKLSLHPTVKPVGLVADAIRDCSNRGGIVLDMFGGAGTTLIAAEKTGRKARLIEIDPKYVDASIVRWQRLTGQIAVNADTGVRFAR